MTRQCGNILLKKARRWWVNSENTISKLLSPLSRIHFSPLRKAIKDVPEYTDQLVVEFKTKKVDFSHEQPISIQMCLLAVPLIKPHSLQLSFTIWTSQPHFYLLKMQHPRLTKEGVVAGAQGTTMSGSRQLLEKPNHIGMRGILRLCRYGTTWLKEGLLELFRTTYINKMHLLFGSPFHKNSTVKRAWLGVVFGWVTYRTR